MGETRAADACRAQPGAVLITVNGQSRTMVACATLRDVVAELGWAELGNRPVGHGDRLEIVTLVGGG